MLFGSTARKIAKKMVAYAQKKYEEDNEMAYFVILYGIGAGKLALEPPYEHQWKLIVDAIHDYQAKYPKKTVKEGYQKAISCGIMVINGKPPICQTLDILDYEFEKRKNGTSAFSLDIDVLLKEMKAKIAQKEDILREEIPNFDRWIFERFDILERKSWER